MILNALSHTDERSIDVLSTNLINITKLLDQIKKTKTYFFTRICDLL